VKRRKLILLVDFRRKTRPRALLHASLSPAALRMTLHDGFPPVATRRQSSQVVIPRSPAKRVFRAHRRDDEESAFSFVVLRKADLSARSSFARKRRGFFAKRPS
jgi:hypothetical protein